MEAATTLPAGPTTGLFAELGGAIFRRAVRILGDEAAGARVAEELFVRFLVYGNAQALDDRGRWNWIYRVVTSHSLRQLPDDARPGASAVGHGPVPDAQALRRLDEPTQNIVVLSALDGLTADEIAEVLGLPAKKIRRRVADAIGGAQAASAHPSTLALDRERARHAEHIASCDLCRAIVAEGDRLLAHFGKALAPLAIPRVGAAVRVERARQTSGPRWRRVLWMAGSAALVGGLALVVARPRSVNRADVPYAGLKGASRARAAGIQISVGHDAEVRALEPATPVVPGDRLYFRMRVERPRYLELRVRDSAGERRLFPVGDGDAVLVRGGQALSVDYLVSTHPNAPDAGATAAQKIWIVGLFADSPFPLDKPPGPDTEVVPVRVDAQ